MPQIAKMLKKFPFGDSLLKDLGILQPSQASLYIVETIINLAKCFPQIRLSDAASLDRLREEFMDFILSSSDFPIPSEYPASDDTFKSRAGPFWHNVGKMKTLDGQRRYGTLGTLMYGLLVIRCSNADSERVFSILREIHTDQRASLDQSTIIALMSMKFNCDNCCHNIVMDSNLLVQCIKATCLSQNKE